MTMNSGCGTEDKAEQGKQQGFELELPRLYVMLSVKHLSRQSAQMRLLYHFKLVHYHFNHL